MGPSRVRSASKQRLTPAIVRHYPEAQQGSLNRTLNMPIVAAETKRQHHNASPQDWQDIDMTTTELVFVVVGGSLWTSLMVVTVITRIYPKWLMVTAPVICRKGEHMEYHHGRASYHRPGETGLTLTCVGSSGRRPVTLRAFFLPCAVLAAVMMIIGAVVALVIRL